MARISGIITTIALAGAIAYAGDAANFRDRVQQAIHPGVRVAEGFYNPYSVNRVIKYEDSTVKGYLQDRSGKLPLLAGPNGVQAGNPDYVWNNLGPDNQQAYVMSGWHKLAPEKKIDLVKRDLESAVSDFFDSLKKKMGF